jgi:nicotinamide-nucleotide amidase
MRLDAACLQLAADVGDALQARRWRLATAESCTGGLVAGAVTAVAGSSAWFDRGFVTYSNAAKHEMLAVPSEVIAAHGAVSEPVARAMVEGARARSGAECALSVTGVAGPGGGTPAKPVGMVCFGWLVPGQSPVVTTRSTWPWPACSRCSRDGHPRVKARAPGRALGHLAASIERSFVT